MMKKIRSNIYLLSGLLGVCIFLLAACGQEDTPNAPQRPEQIQTVNDAAAGNQSAGSDSENVRPVFDALHEFNDLRTNFPATFENHLPILQGGTLNVGLSHDPWESEGQTFTGMMFSFYVGNPFDAAVSAIVNPSLFAMGADGRIITGGQHDGPVIVDIDPDQGMMNITMRDGVQLFWHDGAELTLADLVFAYYFFPTLFQNVSERHPIYHIRGIHDFHRGDADNIVGLQLSEDGRNLKIYFDYFSKGMMYEAVDITSLRILGIPLPRHHLEPIVEFGTWGAQTGITWDFWYHPNLRDNFIGWGAFKIDHTIAGERVVLTANENYFRGVPNLDYLIFHVVNPANALTMLLNGDIDIIDLRPGQHAQFENNQDFYLLGTVSDAQQLLFFNLGAMRDITAGQWSDTATLTARNDNHPITDARFRRALSYAIDRMTIDTQILDGLSRPATSILHPYHASTWIDAHAPGASTFDLNRANALLDEAGFRWDDDGFRVDAYGNPITINLAYIPSATNDLIFALHQYNFEQLGIDLQMFTPIPGRNLMSRDSIITNATHHNPNHNMHMFLVDNTVRIDPNPDPVWLSPWGHESPLNLAGFTSERIQQVLRRINSFESWNDAYRADAFREWDRLFHEYMPAITQSWRLDLTAVNRRVVNYTLVRGSHHDAVLQWHLVGVTS